MRSSLVCILLASLFGVVGLADPASATQPDANGEHKVTICHRTNSNTNPYVQITVDTSAADGQGGAGDHDNEHQGPVWNPSLKAQKIEWGDIIPPIEGAHNGLNWTEGQAIYENGCNPTTPPPPCDDDPHTDIPPCDPPPHCDDDPLTDVPPCDPPPHCDDDPLTDVPPCDPPPPPHCDDDPLTDVPPCDPPPPPPHCDDDPLTDVPPCDPPPA